MQRCAAMFVSLMVALSLTGFAFAHWNDRVYVSGTIRTGFVEADFDSAVSNDPPGTIDPGHDKDVGCTTVTGIGTDTLTVTVTNAYPCYSSRVDYSITNTGTIPVVIQSIEVDENLAAPGIQDIPEIDVTITGIRVGDQIDPSQEENGSIWIHVNQCADEEGTYEFTVTVLSVQWNGYVPPSKGVEIRISPRESSGARGEVVTFILNIKNIGTISDRYWIDAEDTKSWELVYDDPPGPIPPGVSVDIPFRVWIPSDAESCTKDIITITVRSRSDPSVSDVTKCILHCIGPLYTPRPPIHIVGDENFTPANGVVSGSGMENDPYIIEGWDIIAENTHGIWIEDTTAYFIIRYCHIHGGDEDYDGIRLERAMNGRIERVETNYNYSGISLYSSSGCSIMNSVLPLDYYCIILDNSTNNTVSGCVMKSSDEGGIYLGWDNPSSGNTVENCIISNCEDGIYVEESSSVTVRGSTVENCSYGVELAESENCVLRGNVLLNNTFNFGVEGADFHHFYHDIDNSNSINNRPIYYLVGEKGMFFDGNVTEIGYLGLVSCENVWAGNLSIFNNLQGLLLVNTSGSRIINSSFSKDQWGVYLFLSGNNMVENCAVTDCRRGVHQIDSDNNIFSDFMVENNNGFGVTFESSNGNVVQNCTVRNNGGRGISFEQSDYNLIERCVINNNGGYGLWFGQSDNNQVENCVVNPNHSTGVYAGYSENIVIAGTRIDEGWARGSKGIWLYRTMSLSIENCEVFNTGHDGTGIYCYIGQNTTISNCTVENHVVGVFFYAGPARIENTLVKNTYHGIRPIWGSGFLIENCTSEGNQIGISTDHMLDSTVSGCILRNNYWGISLGDESGHNRIRNCLIENNGVGIRIHGSRWNRIYHNNFINNPTQAQDWGHNNRWDSGYPAGGNYWSDYTGVDNFKGENQDIPGPDGIGDTPYPILGAEDRYPLMAPVVDGLVTRPPIHIVGDENFTPLNGVVSGSGTEGDPYVIEGWCIDASSAHGIWIESTTAHFIVRNCLIENGGSSYIGVYLYDVQNGRIERTASNNNNSGIYLHISDNNVLAKNTCRNNMGLVGIWLGYSSNNILTSNVCGNNFFGGIHLFYSDNNVVASNICENSTSIGNGINLTYSDNNIVTSNTCRNNPTGIYLNNSNHNCIYHNNFMSNTQQVYDSGTNFWDAGYPTGGNYWDDYTGEDNFSGPGQNIPGSDGIGDTPYDIPGGTNQDHYPLMNPLW